MHSSNQSASNQTVDQCVSSIFGQSYENMDTELIAATNTCIVPNLLIISIEVRAKLATPNQTTSSATDRDKLLKTMLCVGMQHKSYKTAIFGPRWSPAQGKTVITSRAAACNCLCCWWPNDKEPSECRKVNDPVSASQTGTRVVGMGLHTADVAIMIERRRSKLHLLYRSTRAL